MNPIPGPRGLAAVVLLAAIAGSGCLGPLLPSQDEAEADVTPSAEPPGLYKFDLRGAPAYQVANLEAGGSLTILGAGAVALYDAEDRRIAYADEGLLDNETLARSGDYVVVPYTAGAPASVLYEAPANRTPSFREPGVMPLEVFQSRSLLFDGDVPGQVPGSVTEFEKAVRFVQPPLWLSFGHVGAGTSLDVEVRSASGHVVASQAGPIFASPPGSLGPDPYPLTPWSGDVQPLELANLEGREFDVQGSTDLVGQVYLLATVYARHPAVLLFPSPAAPDLAPADANASASDEAQADGGNAYYLTEVEEGSAYAFEIPEGAEGLAVLPLPPETYGGYAAEERRATPSLLALYGPDDGLAAILVVPDASEALLYAFGGTGRHVLHAILLVSPVQVAPIGAPPADVHLHELDIEQESLAIEVAPGLEGPVAVKRTATFDRPPIGVEFWADWGATWSDLLVTVSREGSVEGQCSGSSSWWGAYSVPPQCDGRTYGEGAGPGLLAGAHQVLLQATEFQGTLHVTFDFFEAAAEPDDEDSAAR